MQVPAQNLLDLMLFFDTNLIGTVARPKRFLDRLHTTGCIAIVVSDAIDTELADAPGDRYESLAEDAAKYGRAPGVAVLGHSRLGSSVWAGAGDVALMDQLRAIVRPGITDWADTRRQHVRDVMHLHAAIRYGASAFVTGDGHLLKKADDLARHIPVWDLDRAAQVAAKRLRNHRSRQRLE